MACSIAISSVTGTVVGGNLTSIQVTGTASGCDQIEVTLRCGGTLVQQTVWNGSGGWTATFGAADVQAAKCFCQKSITASARCVNPNDPNCFKTVTVPQLPCSPPCPTVAWNVLAGACKADGTQPVSLAAVIVPPSGGALIQANLVEGSTVLASGTSSSATSPLTLSYSGDFPSGGHTVCVQFVQPAGCPGQCTTFAVDCTGACCLPDGTCRHGATMEECQHLGGTYMGHGTDCSQVKCPPPPPPDPCQKTFRKWFCPLLVAVMTFGTAIGLALVLLAGCTALASIATTLAGVGAGFAAAGAVALFLFWLYCRKCLCGWFYLFLWRVLFGVGIVLAIFSGCCPNLLWTALPMILAGILFLVLWRNLCHKTLCDLLAEVVTVLAVYILPGISAVFGISSALAGCLWVLFSFGSFQFTFLLLVSIAFASLFAYWKAHC